MMMKPHTVAAACLMLAAALAAQAEEAASTLDNVTVIGKRARQARDIAGGVSAVSDEQLEAAGAQDLADYIQREPGVVFNSYQPGVSNVVVRGIATSSGNVQGQPTTGYFLNEIPLTEPGWTIVIPDIDTFDLARVEVLRGPQGTLFGSGSMGGAIQYIANVADPRGFDAAAETTISSTKNADLAYTAKAMVNVPIKENVLAVRAVAEYRKDPGWLDNVGTGEKGSNTTTLTGGRFSAVLTPSRDTTFTWLSLVQKTDSKDNAYRMPAVGDLQRDTTIAEPTDTRVSVHSLRMDQDLGGAKFTALAATQQKKQGWVFDFTPVRGAYNSDLQLDLTNPLYIADGGKSRSNSLELRLASASGGALEWLIGAMAFDTKKDLYEQLGSQGADAAFDASPLYGAGSGAVIAPDGSVFNAFYTKVKGRESALFGEATYALSPQWKLTAGGRFFRTKVDMTSTQVGFSTYPGAPIVTPSTVSEHGFNPKLSLAWSASPDLMVYALASEGFRFGTPNTPGLSTYPIPAGSKSDSLRNYELGMRSRWADGKVLLDATLFRIDWSDIQLRLQTPDFFAYAANGGKARSTGLEVSFQFKPNAALDWSTSLTWQHARLEEDLLILYYGTAPKGSQLPGTADWSINNRISYEFGGAYRPTLSLSHQFLSSGISDLNSAVPGAVPNKQGNYNLFDARYRMSFDKTDLTLFCSNLTDKRGVTRTVAEANGTGEGLVRPRTFGVTAHWQY
ncbi:TonB-dependent receptor [Paucibacter sp. R3-3]|uniref:TonB-dependent receptor n=1 Tax=Roseateles agri TaxID=3098619 RepID=A0ABU5DPX0_9BURK|nr:TonB-dependent receptor [Paucibacter sp. R3-3]MDY0748370.1 TonB-dependent receptor [Paucibacter sp. R3-3]